MYTRTEAPVTKPFMFTWKILVSAFKYLYPHNMDGIKFANDIYT